MIKVGQVTEQEKDEIFSLFERKNALIELINSLHVDEQTEPIYQRLLMDMTITNRDFNQWWSNMSKKYEWKTAEKGNWNINFATNDIYLIES